MPPREPVDQAKLILILCYRLRCTPTELREMDTDLLTILELVMEW